MTPHDWRKSEKALLDCFRQMGNRLGHVCGRPFIVVEFHDDDGALIERRYVLDIEELARLLSS